MWCNPPNRRVDLKDSLVKKSSIRNVGWNEGLSADQGKSLTKCATTNSHISNFIRKWSKYFITIISQVLGSFKFDHFYEKRKSHILRKWSCGKLCRFGRQSYLNAIIFWEKSSSFFPQMFQFPNPSFPANVFYWKREMEDFLETTRCSLSMTYETIDQIKKQVHYCIRVVFFNFITPDECFPQNIFCYELHKQ